MQDLSSGDMATFAGLATNTMTTAVNNAVGVNGDVVVVVMAETEEVAAMAEGEKEEEEEEKQDEVSDSSGGNSAILEEGDGYDAMKSGILQVMHV